VRKLSIVLFVISISIVFSCSKEKSITNQLDGETWKVVNVSIVEDGGDVKTEKPNRTYFFAKEGNTGTMVEGNLSYTFNWLVEDTYLTINVDGFSKLSRTYDVLNSSRSKQTWTFDYSKHVETFNLEKQ
jgi:hypothetical protein